MLLLSSVGFLIISFSKNSFRDVIRMPSALDMGQNQRSAGPDLILSISINSRLTVIIGRHVLCTLWVAEFNPSSRHI